MGDFHLLEGKPRSAYRQELKTRWVGQQRPNEIIRMKESEWHGVFNLLRKVAEAQGTPKDVYLLALKFLNKKMTSSSGGSFALTFNETIAKKLLSICRKKIFQNSVSGSGPRDISSVNLGVPSLLQKADPADHITALDLAKITDSDGNPVFGKGPSKSEQAINRVVSTQKHGNLHDPLIVYSGAPENEPYYILSRIHTTTKTGEAVSGNYELIIPQAFYYSGGLTSLTHLGVTQKSSFRKIYNQTSPQSFQIIHREATHKSFEDIILPLMHKAWKKGKLYFTQRVKLHRAKEDLKKTTSHSNKNLERYFIAKINSQQAILAGKTPSQEYEKYLHPESKAWPKIKAGLGESATWFMWLLAAEEEYGIRVPERQRMHLTRPQNAAFTQGKAGTQPIRQKVTSRSKGWNQDILAGLGFGRMVGDPTKRLITALQNSNYRFRNAEDEVKRLWVIVPKSYITQHNLSRTPSEISDSLRTAKRVSFHSSNITLLGRVNGQLKAKRNRKNVIGHATKLGTTRTYMLINARDWLKLFDSPRHEGERLQHTYNGAKIVVGNSLPTSYNTHSSGPLLQAGKQKILFNPTRKKIIAQKYGIKRHRQGTPNPAHAVSTIRHSVNRRVAINKALDQAERQLGLSNTRKVMFSPETRATLERTSRLQQVGKEAVRERVTKYILNQNPAGKGQVLTPENRKLVRTAGIRRVYPSIDISKLPKDIRDKAEKMDRPMYTTVANKDEKRSDVTLVPGIEKAKFTFDLEDLGYIKREKRRKKEQEYLAAERAKVRNK